MRTVSREPFPAAYAALWQAADGSSWELRAIRPGDEPELEAFARSISERSAYLRFGHVVRTDRIDHARLGQLCSVDRAHAATVVARRAGTRRISAVARLIRVADRPTAEFALLVADAEQGRGLGTALLEHLLTLGRAFGKTRIVGYVLADNVPMLDICRKLGFGMQRYSGDPLICVSIDLPAGPEVKIPA